MDSRYSIEQLLKAQNADLVALADLTQDVVKQGASIGFMEDFDQAQALAFWQQVFQKVTSGKTLLLVAREIVTKQIVGTVQLQIDLPKNQPHRGDLAKMQVHTLHRRKGIAEQLLLSVEYLALQHNRYLLVLDTVSGSAAQKLYAKCGWIAVGDIPDYALFPDGNVCSTTYMYRKLKFDSTV